MKILILSELYHPHGKGAQIAIKRLAEKLVSLGISVHVITNKFSDEREEEVINGVYVHRRRLFPEVLHVVNYETYLNLHSKSIIKGIIDDIISIDPDLVHIADLWFHAIPILKNFLKLPIVAHIHSYAPVCYYVSTAKYYDYKAVCSECRLLRCVLKNNIYSFRKNAAKGIIRLFMTPFETLYAEWKISKYIESLTYADAVIIPSHLSKMHTVRFIPNKYIHELEGKIVVLPNVVPDNIQFVPYESPSNYFTLIYMGGCDVSKGYLNLLKAMIYVTRKNPQVRLFMTAVYSDLLIHQFIKEYKLENNVFPLPWLSDNALYNLFREVDMLIAPSLWPETFLQTAIEANLMGRATIVSQIGAAREYIEEGVNGFLVNSFDSDSLAKKKF